MSTRGRRSNKRSASKKKTVISAEMPASVATDASGEARSSNAVGVDELAKMKAQMAELKAQIGLLTSKSEQVMTPSEENGDSKQDSVKDAAPGSTSAQHSPSENGDLPRRDTR